MACSARIASGWVVVAWGTETYLGLAGNAYFVYLALRTSALGMGQTIRLGKRNTLCCKNRMEMYFYLVLWFFIFYFCFYSICLFSELASDGCCCWSGRRVPKSPNCWSSCNVLGEIRSVGRMMPREWLVTLRLGGAWVGERCQGP